MRSRAVLKRREFIRGLGAASFLAIPIFRDSFLEAAGSVSPVRFIPIFLPGSGTKGNFTLAGDLAPLAAFQADLIEFKGVSNGAGESVWGITGEPHGSSLRTMLTGDSSVKALENASVFAKGDSIDQTIGAAIGAQQTFTTLQFGVVTETQSNPLDQRRMCFKGGVPQPPIEVPADMLARVFNGVAIPAMPGAGGAGGMMSAGGMGGSATPPPSMGTSSDLSLDNKSMLDLLSGEISALKKLAGANEQTKLDQHLTSLRELEKQVVMGAGSGSTPPPSSVPPGSGGGTVPPPVVVPNTPGAGCMTPQIQSVCASQKCGLSADGKTATIDIPTVTRQQFTLMHQALLCDKTRVASMQLLGTAHTEVNFDWLGIKDDHHALEHNQASGTGPSLDKVQTFFAGEIAYFLNLLKSTKEGDGTMLDHSLVMVFTEFGNAGDHSFDDVPIWTFGRANGKVRPGRTIDYQGNGNNLLLRSILNAFGIDKQVGDAVDGTPISLA